MAILYISDYAGSDWAQCVLAFADMNPGDTLDFENGTFEVFSGVQQYFPAGMKYRNGTFTRPDAQAKFHRIVRTEAAVNDGKTTIFVNCHTDGNKAGQGYGSVFTVDLEQQHGFHAASPGTETVYWYKCSSINNHGDGFNVASGANVSARDLTSLGDLRSAYVVGSAVNTKASFRNCNSVDQKIDIENLATEDNIDVYIKDCNCLLLQIFTGRNSRVHVDGFTSSWEDQAVLNVASYSAADDNMILVENCDFTSGLECQMQGVSNFTIRNSICPSFVVTPIGGGLDSLDIPVVYWAFENVEFTDVYTERGQIAYINHPTDNGVIPYIENPPTSHMEVHVRNCTFNNTVPDGYPIRIYGGELHLHGNTHQNEYLARIVGIGTISTVYVDGHIDLVTTDSAVEYNPTPVDWRSKLLELYHGKLNGLRHKFKTYEVPNEISYIAAPPVVSSIAAVQLAAGFDHVWAFEYEPGWSVSSGPWLDDSAGAADLVHTTGYSVPWENQAPTQQGSLGKAHFPTPFQASIVSGAGLKATGVNFARTEDCFFECVVSDTDPDWANTIWYWTLGAWGTSTAFGWFGQYGGQSRFFDVASGGIPWTLSLWKMVTAYMTEPVYLAVWWDHSNLVYRYYMRKASDSEYTQTSVVEEVGTEGTSTMHFGGNLVNNNSGIVTFHAAGFKRGPCTAEHRQNVYDVLGWS